MILQNKTKNNLFDELGKLRLKDSYMRDEETDPQERFAYISEVFGSNHAHSQRLYNYSSDHWLSYSTPILSFGRTKNGLPISCYLPYLPDSSEGLVNTLSESNWLSMLGGGIGLHLGIRGVGDKSTGVMAHLKTYDSSSLAYRQGRTRRGSTAAYLDISHPDIIQFLEMRKPTGDPNLRTLNLNHGINITDKFMRIIENCTNIPGYDDSWELIQPNSGKVVEVVSAKELWTKILSIRANTGEPYLWFIDTANASLPEYQKAAGLKIHGSNLCSEISLATDDKRTAVCCLSSLNLSYYDDWKGNQQFIPDVLEMLDNVLTYFIQHAPDTISRARYSAMRERSVGIGILGFHALLQKRHVPFESAIAKSLNLQIFKHIRTQLDQKNYELAIERGACPDAADYGIMKRNSHTMAIAPTASASIIMGNTSPSGEPYAANIYRQDTLSGAFINRNAQLVKFINEYAAKNNFDEDWIEEVWTTIVANKGSVSHIEWMTDYDKSVYTTAREVNQMWIIEHAADRQPFIDQAQSVNLYVDPKINVKDLHVLHFQAWKKGLKGLYYCRSEKVGAIDKMSESVERVKIEDEEYSAKTSDTVSTYDNYEGCLACE